jgi:hypothetical protein
LGKVVGGARGFSCMEKYDLLGLRLVMTVLVLLVVFWFCTVHFLGKSGALEMHSTLMQTDPTDSRLDKVWQRTLPPHEPPLGTRSCMVEKVSTVGRQTFRRRTLLDAVYFLHSKAVQSLVSVTTS